MLSLDWWNSDSKIRDETFIQVTKDEQWSVNGINQTSVLSDPVSHMIQVSTLPRTESLEISLCLNFKIRIQIIEIEQQKVGRGKFRATCIQINGSMVNGPFFFSILHFPVYWLLRELCKHLSPAPIHSNIHIMMAGAAMQGVQYLLKTLWRAAVGSGEQPVFRLMDDLHWLLNQSRPRISK